MPRWARMVGAALHAAHTAGKQQHLHPVGVQLLQGTVGADRDAVTAGDPKAVQTDQRYVHAGPAQQIGGHQRLGLLKAVAQ